MSGYSICPAWERVCHWGYPKDVEYSLFLREVYDSKSFERIEEKEHVCYGIKRKTKGEDLSKRKRGNHLG